MNETNGEPAFPTIGTSGYTEDEGISLRDYFAAAALVGVNGLTVMTDPTFAKWVYKIADAMLAERTKNKAKRWSPICVPPHFDKVLAILDAARTWYKNENCRNHEEFGSNEEKDLYDAVGAMVEDERAKETEPCSEH